MMAIAPFTPPKTSSAPSAPNIIQSPFVFQPAVKSALSKVFWGFYILLPFASIQLAHFIHPSPVMQYYFDAAITIYLLLVGLIVWKAAETSHDIWRLLARTVVIGMTWVLISLMPAFNVGDAKQGFVLPTPRQVAHHYEAQQREWVFLKKHNLPLTLVSQEYQAGMDTDPSVKLQEDAQEAYNFLLNANAAKSLSYWGLDLLLACLSLLAFTLTLRFCKR